MKKLSVYAVVITAILLVISITYLQSGISDKRKAKAEPPKEIEVAQENVDTTVEDTDTTINDEGSVYDPVPEDDIPVQQDAGHIEDVPGEIHDAPGIRETPTDVGLPSGFYNTLWDTESMDYYTLDNTVEDAVNVAPATVMEMVDNNPTLEQYVEDNYLKPWYTVYVDDTMYEKYEMHFKNSNLVVVLVRPFDANYYEILSSGPEGFQNERDTTKWTKTPIIYKYLSKYDPEVMADIESKLDFDKMGTDVYWTDYQFGDATAVFWNINDIEHENPVEVTVDVWR